MNIKKMIKYIGIALSITSPFILIGHRFLFPDLTQIQWLLEFWYVWLAGIGVLVSGYVLYLYGNGDLK